MKGSNLMAETEETKHWYLSKGLWGSLIVVMAFIVRLLGQEPKAATIEAESDMLTQWLIDAMTLGGAMLAFIGRMMASKKITT